MPRTIAIAGPRERVRDWPEKVRIGQGSGKRAAAPKRVRVGIVAIPDAGLATLSGIFDVLQSLALLVGREGVPDHPPFQVELLGETADPVRLASAHHHAAARGRGGPALRRGDRPLALRPRAGLGKGALSADHRVDRRAARAPARRSARPAPACS